MTDHKKNRAYFSHRSLFGVVSIVSFLLILFASDTAIDYMKKGLILCSATVIPSLFPFMVISELIVSSGIGIRLSRFFSRPMRALFGISEAGAAAYLLGAVCGFPIGAKTAAAMYDRGDIGKGEFERLLTFCNNPGSAFVISAVGVSLLGNELAGMIIYACVILSSVIVGIFGKLFTHNKNCGNDLQPVIVSNEIGMTGITNAVQSSALSMLTVCAYVVFFSAFVGCIGALLSRLALPLEAFACIFGFFELSSGVGAAAELDNKLLAILLCALFSGWSGLSVHFQIMSVCSGKGVSFKPYFIAKAAQGIICALLAYPAVKWLFPSVLSDNSAVFLPNESIFTDMTRYICLALFFSSAIFALFSSRKGIKKEHPSK